MKRKLNEEDVPAVFEVDGASQKSTTFAALGLDSRLLQAVAKQNFSSPTSVQSRAISLAFEGKDIIGGW